MVVDFKGYHSYYGVRLNNAVLGVMTAYCEMPNRATRCPHWVDQSIDAAPIGTTATNTSAPGADDGATDAGYSNSLNFPLPSITNPDGTVSEQHVSTTSTQPAGFIEAVDPLDTFDGNDPDYNGDDTIICGQCPPPDDGT